MFKFLIVKMCNSALGLRMHLRLNYLSIYLSVQTVLDSRPSLIVFLIALELKVCGIDFF